nr:uncharacterized protein DDB_G0274171-like [Parasteatoda tepidariorum]
MHKILLILLFIHIIVIDAVVPICPILCPEIKCDPGYVLRRIGCCDQCVKDSQPQEPVMNKVLLILLFIHIIALDAVLSTCAIICPEIECEPGYVPKRAGCCYQCVKEPDDCRTDCSGSYSCPAIPAECPDGEELVTPICRCCPECQKI